ncbi:hypothetical protein DL766_005161 [Monosporascus sp. MC13-8B]|nr:hypothetical protein DL763_005689 [Monosporascus cannonballus]RYP29862.1 hypothetical protein DL766_005161 [Monosporascus sp. MC13-8B]
MNLSASWHVDDPLRKGGCVTRPEWRLDGAESPKEAVSWRDMPRKTQLVAIVLARLSEPLAQTSLQSYVFYQLKWFDPNLPDSVISGQAGVLNASFTAAQLFTALIWGRVADSPGFGRKTVILIGLLGTFLSCIGFGFSTSFYQALFFRCLGGATNGNVGVLRTMISETVREKKYQARAFVLLPMCFNIGVIIGPILGGLLSDPAGSYPAFGLGTFNSLWAVFLSTPVFNPKKPKPLGFVPRPPLAFTGGLGLPPQKVGGAMALLGVIGIVLQLFLYPKLSARLGTLRSYRMFIFCFPIAYTLMPYLSLVPSTTPPPNEKTGPWMWIAVVCLLSIQVVGRTFALPAQTILVNNCSPHPSALGTVHGFGVSVNSFARTIGPILCGWLYGIGLSRGCVGAVFWGLAGVALCGWAASFWLKEGNGHEIWLEGDDEVE